MIGAERAPKDYMHYQSIKSNAFPFTYPIRASKRPPAAPSTPGLSRAEVRRLVAEMLD